AWVRSASIRLIAWVPFAVRFARPAGRMLGRSGRLAGELSPRLRAQRPGCARGSPESRAHRRSPGQGPLRCALVRGALPRAALPESEGLDEGEVVAEGLFDVERAQPVPRELVLVLASDAGTGQHAVEVGGVLVGPFRSEHLVEPGDLVVRLGVEPRVGDV